MLVYWWLVDRFIIIHSVINQAVMFSSKCVQCTRLVVCWDVGHNTVVGCSSRGRDQLHHQAACGVVVVVVARLRFIALVP